MLFKILSVLLVLSVISQESIISLGAVCTNGQRQILRFYIHLNPSEKQSWLSPLFIQFFFRFKHRNIWLILYFIESQIYPLKYKKKTKLLPIGQKISLRIQLRLIKWPTGRFSSATLNLYRCRIHRVDKITFKEE